MKQDLRVSKDFRDLKDFNKKNKTMKKTYNQPTCLVVALGTCHMMAESLTINTNSTNTIGSSSEILVKEQNVSDVNLWDNEW